MAELALSPGPGVPRAKSRDDQETRARVLNAAARLFAERGFASA